MAHEFEDFPEFLKIAPGERKAAWEEFLAAHKPPPAAKLAYRRIDNIPGANPHEDPDA